ncbi:glycine-rich RNA-binding protein 7-like [Lolium rigidum]|uniref:glycine-rich RNA-binding protein 7-like n=1 Tax=Lolium rigidum TaxID=89674 RepID=UPI001F5C2A69|nr:glycine-rich RNA-binding protein 7-like [Lolium rigidum]
MSCPWWDNDDDGSPEHRVRVSNLPWRADERSLKDAFADYDPIYADIVTDRETGRSRGFGFVAFKDSKSMNDAIEGMNGQDLGVRTITVSEANQRTRRQRR